MVSISTMTTVKLRAHRKKVAETIRKLKVDINLLESQLNYCDELLSELPRPPGRPKNK